MFEIDELGIISRLLPLTCLSGSLPDLLSAVKLLAGSTVEIAAASVGERSLVKVVRQIEEDGKSIDSSLEAVEPEILEYPTEPGADETTVEAAAEDDTGELKSAGGDAEDAEAPVAEEETPAPVTAAEDEEEKTAASPSEELTTSAPTEEQTGDAEAEEQPPVTEAAPVEAASPTEASSEDAAPTEEVTISVEEAEEPVEGTEAVETVQLAEVSSEVDAEVLSAAESESGAPVHEAESCHCAPPAAPNPSADELAPPIAVEGELACGETTDLTQESEEEVAQSKN